MTLEAAFRHTGYAVCTIGSITVVRSKTAAYAKTGERGEFVLRSSLGQQSDAVDWQPFGRDHVLWPAFDRCEKASTCANEGCTNDVRYSRICNNCWEVEHRLEKYLKTAHGRRRVQELLCSL